MEQQTELQQILYRILTVQIEFGTYREGERLPSIEESSQMFFVSSATVRSAYLKLKQKGYIRLNRNTGAVVIVHYTQKDIEDHIRDFFAPRREAMLDIGRNMNPLFGHIQLSGFQRMTDDTLSQMESLAYQRNLLPVHRLIGWLQCIYGSLDNDLLIRLVWQTFMFYQAPFLSLPSTPESWDAWEVSMLHMINLCRQKDWDALKQAIASFQNCFYQELCQYYDSQIPPARDGDPVISFQWNSYQKASQLCYSLAMDILTSINRGVYPAGTLLPSLEKLARERNVSVSTIRRMLSLLNSIGITKSINGLGTRVLSQDEIWENCDFTQPALRRRLHVSLQSLQIFALSCRGVLDRCSLELDEDGLHRCRDYLCLMRHLERCELAPFGVLSLIIQNSQSPAVQVIYNELFQQLMWAYSLRALRTEADVTDALYCASLDHLLCCLDNRDTEGFSSLVEMLLDAKYTSMMQILAVIK